MPIAQNWKACTDENDRSVFVAQHIGTKNLRRKYPYQRRLLGFLVRNALLGVLGGRYTDHSYARLLARGPAGPKWPAELRRQPDRCSAAILLCEMLHMRRQEHSTGSVFMHQFSDRSRPALHVVWSWY